ncbi:MAG: VPLPA-CTERM sorting domain-containing protein, partial [Gammaproteobacteria bacterium]
ALAAYISVFSISVNAVTVATSTTSTGCGLTFTSNYKTIGPLNVAGEDSCDNSGSTSYGNYTAVSNVKTGFGPAIPKVGVVDAAAAVVATATDPQAPVGTRSGGEAIATGSVTFYFTVEEIRTPPSSYNPSTYIEANAQASFHGFTTGPGEFDYEGEAGAYAILPGGIQWEIARYIPGTEESWSDSFSESINLDLAPNDLANPFYVVTISAGCYVAASAGGENNSRAECQSNVDPTIYLDQEAFDAKYGSESFILSDYYRLQFSDNVDVVPVPAAAWLFGSGLVGLIGISRRKKAVK